MTWLGLSGNGGYPARVRTGGVLAQYLRVLVTQLAASCELLLFPYDLRQDYWRLADELRDFLRL